MSNTFDEVQNYVWDLRGDVSYIVEHLSKIYPNASVLVVTVDPFQLPPNVVACCGAGSGEVIPVARWMVTKLISNKKGEVLNIDLEQLWTSPEISADDPGGWNLYFWDNEKDEEVYF